MIIVNSKKPLITVITVCFNAHDYIEQCIQSVIGQDFNDFEYVIIDGGSTDGTQNTLDKYKNKLAYWHSKPDRGLAHAFNRAVKNSLGQWLIFLNSDDFFVDDNVLSKMSEVLHEHKNDDVVFGQVNIVSRENAPVKIGGPHGGPFLWRKFLTRDTIPHQAAFTNYKLFDKNGCFNERFKIAVDYEHYLRTGSALSAIFSPILVSSTRDGGLSQQNNFTTLIDLHKARVENKVLPYAVNVIIVTYFLARAYIGNYVKRALGIFHKMKK
jgi:glycosyltransferase involved in cell wall biosynthesis